MALFVVSYARRDGEPLVRRFFNHLSGYVATMNPTVPVAGFMDTVSIPTGTAWSQTLGSHLSSAPVLVPVFSPSFFASQECGREVQAFLRRIDDFQQLHPGTGLPPCIMPVIWIWENLSIHPCLTGFHWDNVKYPAKYRTQKAGGRLLADISDNLNQLKTLAYHLAAAITGAVNPALPVLPPLTQLDYAGLPSAFRQPVAPPPGGNTRLVQFAYVAPSALQMNGLRSIAVYGDNGREWRAFDPVCSSAIGHLSESVAARMNLPYATLPVNNLLNAAPNPPAGKLTVFVLDSWAARLPEYAPIFRQLDGDTYRQCPVLVPLNEQDGDNSRNRSQLLAELRDRFPARVRQNGNAFVPVIANEDEYEEQLSRVLAARVNDVIGGAAPAPQAASLPVL